MCVFEVYVSIMINEKIWVWKRIKEKKKPEKKIMKKNFFFLRFGLCWVNSLTSLAYNLAVSKSLQIVVRERRKARKR